MYRRPIVPADFVIPEGPRTGEFLLRPLTVHDVVKDFDCVIDSAGHLRRLYGGTWPDGLTIEQNLIHLAWHQREFDLRHSFAYTVSSLDGALCLGCCYIYPPADPDVDVDAFYWARGSRIADGLEDRLGTAFRDWLERDWPFTKVAFPGRP